MRYDDYYISDIQADSTFSRKQDEVATYPCQGIRYALEVPARFQLSKLTSEPETPHTLLRVSPFYEPAASAATATESQGEACFVFQTGRNPDQRPSCIVLIDIH
ncbi:hypothetical protein V1477_019843 [Vespula maculifrons]|uniref:Uncharacterized protein n=1 Tax=Vespula maculifrons TaxID=7453 RepID=A0ABD2AK85_VESMC